MPLVWHGAYDPQVRVCWIDFTRVKQYASLMPEVCATEFVACILIHEATLTGLFSMDLPYDAKRRVGIEL
jgi:hypothetical protein